MKKILFIIILIISVVGQVSAQFQNFEQDNNSNNRNNNNNRTRFVDRLRYGGNFGIGFGSGQFTVQLNPIVGYSFNEYVTAGVIVTYEHYKYDNGFSVSSSNIYGGGVYADCYPLDALVIHAEAQAICYDNYYYYANGEKKVDVPLLIGGGYRKRISDRSALVIMFLWNLNATDGLEHNTSFSNPIIRASFVF